MSAKFDRVRADAMQLSDEERAELARELVRSLDAPPDDNADSAWEREISRRLSAIDAGSVALIDRSEFRRRMENRLKRV